MKKVLIFIYIVLIIVFIKFAGTFILNKYYIKMLDDGELEKANFENLLWLNFEEPYIAYYNLGNRLYEEKEYVDAIEEYEKALEKNNIPEGKECSIRINLALARLGTVKEEYDAEENIKDTLEKLGKAKDVLLEEDCASEDGDGHSKKAQKLKEEIDEIEKELKEKLGEKPEEPNKEDPKKEEPSGKNSAEEEEKLKEILENTTMERGNEIQGVTEMQGYEFYTGKKW